MTRHLHRLFAVAAVLVIITAAWIPGLDAFAKDKVDDGFTRALATFAAARALNAVISVAQGTELAIQPAGVGLNFAPGQVLDLVNDLVEQFSTLMLMASAAFGVQKVLINIGSWWPLSVAVSAAAVAWAVMRWRSAPVPWLSQALVLLLVLRFLVPVVTLASEALYQRFLQDDYQAAEKTLEASTSELGGLSGRDAKASAPESLMDRMRRLATPGIDVGARFEALKAVVNRTVEHVVRLIVVFLLQTLVLPLLLGWAFWRLARAMVVGRQLV